MQYKNILHATQFKQNGIKMLYSNCKYVEGNRKLCQQVLIFLLNWQQIVEIIEGPDSFLQRYFIYANLVKMTHISILVIKDQLWTQQGVLCAI